MLGRRLVAARVRPGDSSRVRDGDTRLDIDDVKLEREEKLPDIDEVYDEVGSGAALRTGDEYALLLSGRTPL